MEQLFNTDKFKKSFNEFNLNHVTINEKSLIITLNGNLTTEQMDEVKI